MGLRRLRLSEIATSERKHEVLGGPKNYLAFLAPEPVPFDHEEFVEQLLAVPDERNVWFEEETCNQLLLDTEAPGDPREI
jgi:hypothetical protein